MFTPSPLRKSRISDRNLLLETSCEPRRSSFRRETTETKTYRATTPLSKTERHVVPRFPFCEAYDGVNLRRTETISQSIQECIQHSSPLDACSSADDGRTKLSDHGVSSDGASFGASFQGQSVNPNGRGENENKDKEKPVRHSRIKRNPDHLFILSGTQNTTYIMPHVDPSSDTGGDDVKGYVDLFLDYRSKENCLKCTVIGGKITKKHRNFPDTFVTVNLLESGEKRHRTRVVKRSREPIFDETFVMEHVNKAWLHVLVVKVELWNKRMFRNVLIGDSLIWLDDIDILSHERMAIRLLLK